MRILSFKEKKYGLVIVDDYFKKYMSIVFDPQA